MKKVKTWILFALAYTFLFPIQAFASGLPENTFLDVPESHPYYDAVEYLADKGIILYAANFRPDDTITSDEFAAMLVRAFYPDMVQEPAPANDMYFYYRAAVSHIALEDFNRLDYTAPNVGHHLRCHVFMYVMGSAGICPYPSAAYDMEALGYTVSERMDKFDDLRDYTCAAYMMGLANPANDPDGIPSRGETAQLFYQILSKSYNEQPEPDVLGRFDRLSISDDTSTKVRNGVIVGLALLPDNIIDAFNKQGWLIRIGEEITDFYPYPQYVGFAEYNTKIISLGCDGFGNPPGSYCTVHEFGHFLHTTYNLTAAKNAMYRYELDAIVDLTRDYAATNSNEAFSEMFALIVTKQDSPEKLLEIQEKAPLTYAVIQLGIMESDMVCNLDIVQQAVSEYTQVYTAAA